MIKQIITILLLISLVKAPAPAEIDLTEDEVEFIAAVVEAESDRSEPNENELTTDGRVYIAAVIINRVNSEYFPGSVNAVLTQRGQFSTVRNGHSIVEATDYSREAVYEAIELLEAGEIPSNLLFFNCIGYNYGTAYDYIGGNYFMTYGT